MIEEFPDKEIEFISNQEIIKTKNRLTNKIAHHLEDLRSHLVQDIKEQPFPGIHFSTGKISKGENHLGFPYLVLDYPAIFKREDMFALRTIVWWGNHISNIFILKGKYLNHFKKAFDSKLTSLPAKKLFYKGESPWINEVNKKYISCCELKPDDVSRQVNDHGFVKIIETYSFTEINNLKENTLAFLNDIRKIMY